MYGIFHDYLANSTPFQFGRSRQGNASQDTRSSGQSSAQTHHQTSAPAPITKQVMAPPASRRAIENLTIVQVTSDDLIEESNKECLICLCDQTIGSRACKLACGHLYHQECLVDWLKKSCTCPVCRYELETDDNDYERERKYRMLKRKMRFRLDELKSKKVGQLRDVASILHVSLSGCIDKSDVIEKLLGSGMIEIIEGVPTVMKTSAEFEAMGVSELRSSLLSFGLSDQGALEKNELRSRLLESGRIILIGVSPPGRSVASSSYGEAARTCNTRNLNNYMNESTRDSKGYYEMPDAYRGDSVKESSSPMKSSSQSSSNSAFSSNSYAEHSSPSSIRARESTPYSSSSSANASGGKSAVYFESDIQNMSVSELRKVSVSLDVSIVNCLYREDIVDRLLKSGLIARNSFR